MDPMGTYNHPKWNKYESSITVVSLQMAIATPKFGGDESKEPW